MTIAEHQHIARLLAVEKLPRLLKACNCVAVLGHQDFVVYLGLGSGFGIHEFELFLAQKLGELARVCYGRGAENELNGRAVLAAPALEPSQHVAGVGAERAAVGVNLVYDYELERLPELDELL